MESNPVKLNLGCGKRHWQGFINVDMEVNHSGITPDIAADIFTKLPFEDNYADEAHAIHVIEHAYIWQVIDILKEWKRVLKPGGLLVLELPNLEKILFWFRQTPLEIRKTWWGLYGDPSYGDPSMTHHWAYTPGMVVGILKEAGFEDIKEEVPKFHLEERDMRIVARKSIEERKEGESGN